MLVFSLHICLGCQKFLKRQSLAVHFRTKQDLCFFCRISLMENVKLIFSGPPFKCQPDCLKDGFTFYYVSLFFVFPKAKVL